MTPRFADAVDPILIHAFSLMQRIDGGSEISPAEEKRTFEGLFQQADRRLEGFSDDWELAKYALASWIDEMLVDAHIWPGQLWWRDNVLEWTLFKSRRCNDLYYVNANQALNSGFDDALQLIYVCVMLGFRGLYRDSHLNRMLIDKYGLPSELPAWASEYAGVVGQARQRWNEATAGQESDREIATAMPLWSRAHMVWPWLIVTLLVGLVALTFLIT
ncbi:DotU family type IV/VI secretion system protein [Stieleria sp. JC731]|uniref:DotU family type IV/VI secretion system protein n=1 Tax=Pirellulaceae TaxID=2691357 RepID=UPI001E486E88|nr:DotU family type IV/VI secretion system protein [Stieleria sp. JC731]MCC9603432.1 DotU family type IV/VI secretion system protein [Stieleria sp. JC731]